MGELSRTAQVEAELTGKTVDELRAAIDEHKRAFAELDKRMRGLEDRGPSS